MQLRKIGYQMSSTQEIHKCASDSSKTTSEILQQRQTGHIIDAQQVRGGATLSKSVFTFESEIERLW
jgi:hypothetical protein